MEIVQAVKKLNSISRERLNFRRRPILCTTLYGETLCKRATSVAHLTNFSFDFFIKVSQKMPLYLFYTMVQKSQIWPKTQIKGVSCLKTERHSMIEILKGLTHFCAQTSHFLFFFSLLYFDVSFQCDEMCCFVFYAFRSMTGISKSQHLPLFGSDRRTQVERNTRHGPQ